MASTGWKGGAGSWPFIVLEGMGEGPCEILVDIVWDVFLYYTCNELDPDPKQLVGEVDEQRRRNMIISSRCCYYLI